MLNEGETDSNVNGTYYPAPCRVVKESVFRCDVVPEKNRTVISLINLLIDQITKCKMFVQ